MKNLRPGWTAMAALLAPLAFPQKAHAGMPVVLLSDIARARLDTISFFILLVLVCAALVRLLWNYLAKDFTKLPKLSYPKALSAVVLWGLVFLTVLTMISGARELMTPGAWEKQGSTYRLKEGPR